MFVIDPTSTAPCSDRSLPVLVARPRSPLVGGRGHGPHVSLLALALANVERVGEAMATLRQGLRNSPAAGHRRMVRRRLPADSLSLSQEV
jgi:hypothetical protein